MGVFLEITLSYALLPELIRLTTFSSFSAELWQLISVKEYGTLLVFLSAHIMGSLVMFVLGMLSTKHLMS